MDFWSILKDFGVPIMMIGSGYFLGKRKNLAETKKTEAEADKINVETEIAELDLFEKLSKLYKQEISSLTEKVTELTEKIEDMEKLIGDLKTNQCYDTTCTLRKYGPKTRIVKKNS